MKTVATATFKAQCLSILDRLTPEGIIVTKRGRPVARVLPAKSASLELIGSLRGQLKIHGDLTSTGAVWDAHD